MKNHVMLTVASLLSILLLALHLADDIVRGMAPGGPLNMIGLAVLAGWVCATLVLAGRRSGYVINLVLSLLAAGVPGTHNCRNGGRPRGAHRPLFFLSPHPPLPRVPHFP